MSLRERLLGALDKFEARLGHSTEPNGDAEIAWMVAGEDEQGGEPSVGRAVGGKYVLAVAEGWGHSGARSRLANRPRW